MPLLLEWKAKTTPSRHLHWIHVPEVPEVVLKTSLLTGRQVKDEDGVWRPMALSKNMGLVMTIKIQQRTSTSSLCLVVFPLFC